MRLRISRRVALTALVLGVALAWVGPAAAARANGAPVNITLAYLDGVSTWGPAGAAGVAELVLKEGELRLTASGLTRLDGEEYWVWLVNTRTNERRALAGLNATTTGVARLDVVLDEPVPDRDWNLLLLSVEGAGGPGNEPGARRSIAGHFPIPSGTGERPAELPRTGGAALPDSAGSAGTLGGIRPEFLLGGGLLAVLVIGAVGFFLGRRGTRRHAS